MAVAADADGADRVAVSTTGAATRPSVHDGRPRRVAVLSKKNLASNRYDQWLAGRVDEVLLFAADTPQTRDVLAQASPGFAEVSLFDDWKLNREIDLAVYRAHAEAPLDRIVTLSECDVVRAAQIRTRLGLPGQQLESATAFRDKAAMKGYAAAAGLSVPAHRRVRTITDLLDFAAGYPAIVVKPLDGAGSRDVSVLRGTDQVGQWARRAALNPDEDPRLLVEEWVDGEMLLVDGLMAGGRACAAMVSRYTRTCLSALRHARPLGVLQLDPDCPEAEEALRYVDRLLAALPCPAELTSFHAELFEGPRGLVLCEIACRTGGGNLDRVAASVLGVSLEYASCLGQAGVPPPISRRDPGGGRVLGFLLLPASGRVLCETPGPCSIPGVLDLTLHASVGQQTVRATKVSEYSVDALFEATDHSRLRALYDQVVRWLDNELVWC